MIFLSSFVLLTLAFFENELSHLNRKRSFEFPIPANDPRLFSIQNVNWSVLILVGDVIGLI